MTAAMTSAGALLREWRHQRGISQLHLAMDASVSARHISFVENGRSRPSREMIVCLSEALEIPLRERNRILEVAGFAALYRHTALDDPALDHIRSVIDVILDNQLPAGAIAVDWNWNVLRANRAMLLIVARFVDPALLAEPPINLMRLVFSPDGLHRFVENWEEVGPIMVSRIRREAEHVGKDDARALLDELLASPAVATDWGRDAIAPPPLLIPLHLRRDDFELRLFSTITTLGTPQDVTLQELRIESFYPMDAASQATLERLCAGS
ncbi:MAG: helix-turn-helix transcriptional regulator [Deltaproteobacteria bacterium]|nr:helix-turn-helix transcriptional regulator [Deltaproteobacteria bacterium]MBW2401972.1 helix-turn-helix transcriptional regulator [Deltaproteobacteria bacterium]MBW2666188.1 helix-turn-helix transcriptional regulator [Deltaproteobacteria bacterium]